MGKSLVLEHVWSLPSILEVTTDGLPTRIKAIVQQADAKNQNNRIYPRAVLEREISKFNIDPPRRPGLVDHPVEPFASVEHIGILWHRAWIEPDGRVWAEGSLVETQKGKDLQAVIKAGVEIGFSSRGYATGIRTMMNGEDVIMIGDDYELETFDAVVDPSVAEARIKVAEGTCIVDGTLNEVVSNETVDTVLATNTTNDVYEIKEGAPADTVLDNAISDALALENAKSELAKLQGAVESYKATLVEKEDAINTQAHVVSELTARLAEADLSVDQLKGHVAHLGNVISGVIQVAHDALDREDFYATSVLADMGSFIKYLQWDIEWGIEDTEENAKINATLAEMRKIFETYEKSRLALKVVDRCKNERFGIVLARRVLDRVRKINEIDEAVASESHKIETALAERRSGVAPKGNPADAPKSESREDKERAEQVRLVREMNLRAS